MSMPAFCAAGIVFGALGALGTVLGQGTVGGGAARPAELPPIRIEAPASGPSPQEDCRLSLVARQELYKDGAFGGLQLGATVRGSVAFVWGTVPDVALARLAEERVGKVPGVGRVENEVRIDTSLKIAPSPSRIATAEAVSPITAGTLSDPGRTSITARLMDQSSEKSRDFPLPASPKSAPAPMVTLPPISLTGTPASPLPAAEVTTPARRPAQASALYPVVEKARNRSPSLSGLYIQVQEGVVRLSGVVAHFEDAVSFAQTVSRLPGVERVILENITVGHRPSLSIP
jgi:BON domain